MKAYYKRFQLKKTLALLLLISVLKSLESTTESDKITLDAASKNDSPTTIQVQTKSATEVPKSPAQHASESPFVDCQLH